MKIPTPEEIAKQEGACDPRSIFFGTECAAAMAEAIRDALRESAKGHAVQGGNAFNSASWALQGFSNLIDQALGTSETQTEKGRA